MGYPDTRVLDLPRRLTGNKYVIRFAAELFVHFVDHSHATGTDRVAEALQPAVGIDCQASVKGKETRFNIFPGLPPLAPSHVFIDNKLGDGEAVVDFGKVNLFPGVGYPRRFVGHSGRIYRFIKMGEVIVIAELSLTPANR